MSGLDFFHGRYQSISFNQSNHTPIGETELPHFLFQNTILSLKLVFWTKKEEISESLCQTNQQNLCSNACKWLKKNKERNELSESKFGLCCIDLNGWYLLHMVFKALAYVTFMLFFSWYCMVTGMFHLFLGQIWQLI